MTRPEEFTGRCVVYDAAGPEVPGAAWLVCQPHDRGPLQLAPSGRMVVLTNWSLVRLFFANAGVEVQGWGVIPLGPAEWESLSEDPAFRPFDDYAELSHELLGATLEAVQILEQRIRAALGNG